MQCASSCGIEIKWLQAFPAYGSPLDIPSAQLFVERLVSEDSYEECRC